MNAQYGTKKYEKDNLPSFFNDKFSGNRRLIFALSRRKVGHNYYGGSTDLQAGK